MELPQSEEALAYLAYRFDFYAHLMRTRLLEETAEAIGGPGLDFLARQLRDAEAVCEATGRPDLARCADFTVSAAVLVNTGSVPMTTRAISGAVSTRPPPSLVAVLAVIVHAVPASIGPAELRTCEVAFPLCFNKLGVVCLLLERDKIPLVCQVLF